ncbi:ribulose-phosphate 3-epimerase [Patescibacteria group bacterium]|nr:MAG: ribulose-phosphate 3-epimerase [Patescibacteria group bacterium]
MIIPTILVSSFDEFATQAKKLKGVCDYAQIDVMDGVFVPNKSFGDIEKINGLKSGLKWELHLMAADPLAEMEKWKEVKNVFRVIFHIETADDPEKIIAAIHGNCWQAGIALNPETPLSAIEPYLNLVDLVLFLTVRPGKQGAKFLPEVKEKVKTLVSLPLLEGGQGRGYRPLIAVDGGIKSSNIAEIKSWGVDIFCVGSALVMAKDIKKTYKELTAMTNIC